ncbi:23S rRNA (cytidine2498-2'-O)-methyltransferase [Paenibacillus sp. BK033]|uniref:SAM-dependent methyltransferase n=1 Tax=Paenibacillus sp. BK033 TaxID=2512133 RepID=UPI0010485186|nr:SAM-dependent methyltransferase [Paenibacillus sp. BK033]TCN01939.1 23S rRNA (cytidine2498-2'-O)-methyltransferase [Paenibacillus sp. BK033]
MSRWIGTANQGYSPYAIEELRRLLDGVKVTQLAAGETFLFDSERSAEDVASAVKADKPIFLRHLQPVDRTAEIKGNADDLQELSETIRRSRLLFEDKQVAIHVRRSSKTAFPYSASDTKAVLDAVLEELEAEPVVQQPDIIIAIYAAASELYIGFGKPEDMLSDWPGGAIRFQREEGQISRAKFKLLEAEREFGLDYSAFSNAIDIGAAPGGWTSLLLERGLRVTAIDPGDMHPSLAGHPALTYLKRNASEVKFKPGSFDLLVCDMSWSPMQMCRLVLDLEESLAPHASAIITIKLMHKKPLQTIREVKERFSTAFIIKRAKQLFHNREEITLYLEKKR